MNILHPNMKRCEFDVHLIQKMLFNKYDGVNILEFYFKPIRNSISEIFNPRKKKCILDIGFKSNLQLILNKKITKVDMYQEISFKKPFLGQKL
jgi:hypothetical protein